MLLVMERGATPEQVQAVVRRIEELGYEARPLAGRQRTAVAVLGNDGSVDAARFSDLAGVEEIVPVTEPYRKASREWRAENTVIRLPGGSAVGGDEAVVMAGPCSVESERQIVDTARRVRDAGATVLRAAAPSNPAARRTASRVSASPAWSGSRRPVRRPGSRWSPK